MRDDLKLIKQLQNQDGNALSAIYDQYSGALYGVILRICKNEEMAQDLLQETFLKNLAKVQSIRSKKRKILYLVLSNCKEYNIKCIKKSF